MVVPEGSPDEGERIDRYLATECPGFTRSYLQKLIKEGQILVNDAPVKVSYPVKAGDSILIREAIRTLPLVEPEDIPLDILYEDKDIILVNKPKGMVVHPAAGHYSGTLVNALLYHCPGDLSGINGVMRPGIVHRIDRDTTGVIVVCKNDTSHKNVAAQLKDHSVNRLYRAICMGNIKEEGLCINAAIGRSKKDRKKMAVVPESEGKHAVTHVRVLERFGEATYIECRLETGRTHQIRVHLSDLGHPLLGDAVYGPEKQPYKLEGQALHAMVLGLTHPTTGEYIERTAPLPEYFTELLEKLRKKL
ncbi:MAG: RluA family pseudouridine synthase [Lachnospiraceae bacterium]|nr:RluA family pseudouridine synthase [Lachnospiraceae bacterium]